MYYCEKCSKTMGADQFYTSNNLIKYPNDGKLNLCKKCLTMHLDNWNPDTFLWILEELDVPWVPDEWNAVMAKYAKDPAKLTGTSILGRYLSRMKLKQYKDFRWADNAFVQELLDNKKRQAMQKSGYSAKEIAEAISKGQDNVVVAAPPPPPPKEDSNCGSAAWGPEPEIDIDLTDEDRTYLSIKWGKNYRPDHWVTLEQLYNDMMNSYDIQTAGHIDILKLACKASLKANQLLDMGDIDGAQKAVKMYDSLMKSGKFTAAQNKAENGEYIDSISELVMICEKEGFIPRYYVDGPQDKVDRVLEDTQRYVYNLVTEEMGLGNLIENAIKQLKDEQESIQIAGSGVNEEDLFDYDKEVVELSDEDYDDFKESEELAAAADEEYLMSLLDEGADE